MPHDFCVSAPLLPHQADPPCSSATEICQFALQVTRQAYADRDAQTFVDRFVVPHSIGTFEGERRVESAADIEAMFHGMCIYFRDNGIVDLRRRVIAADFRRDDLIEATFVSQHVSRGDLVGQEVVVHTFLKRIDGRWRFGDSRYATELGAVSRTLLGKRPDP